MPKLSHYKTAYFLELYAPEVYEMFVYKHTEKIEYVKIVETCKQKLYG